MENIFTSGLAWKTFRDLEVAFLNYTEYVPLRKEHDGVYSHKLLQLLLQVGSSIDTLFKNMTLYEGFDDLEVIRKTREKVNTNSVGMTDFRKSFDPIYELSSQEVEIRQDVHVYGKIKPFEYFNCGKNPGWWRTYTAIKHDWYKNIQHANLGTTAEALAGLFLLNVIHVPNRPLLVDYEVIKSGSIDNPEYGGLARGFLKELLTTYRARLPKRILVADVYARTSAFLYVFSRQD